MATTSCGEYLSPAQPASIPIPRFNGSFQGISLEFREEYQE